MNDDLSAAKAKVRAAWDLWRILGGKMDRMNEMVRSRRLEHDELLQLSYSMRSVQVARERALDDVKGWRRIVDRLEGRDPDPKGSISRRMATPGYLNSTTSRPSGYKGSISLGGRGSISLGRSAGYRTRMLGSS
jgi:hypothetical protein